MGFMRIGRHIRIRALLSSYVDGQLTTAEDRRVREHLSQCDACRREVESLTASVQLLRQLPELQVSRSFMLEAAPTPIRVTGPSAWPMGLATAAAAFLLAALLMGDVFDLLRQTGPVQMPAAEKMVDLAPAAAVRAPEFAAAPAPMAPVPSTTLLAEQEAAIEVQVGAAEKAPTPLAEREAAIEVQVEAVEEAPAQRAELEAPLPEAQVEAVEETPAQRAEMEAPTLAAAVPRPGGPPEEQVVTEEDAEATTEKLVPDISAPRPSLEQGVGGGGLLERDVQEIEPGEPGGVRLPLRELELAAGALLGVMMLATLWLARRRRRWSL